MNSSAVLQEIDETQRVLDLWYQQSSNNLRTSYTALLTQLRQLEERLTGEPASSPQMQPTSTTMLVDSLLTPNRPAYSDDRGTPAMASPPISHAAAVNYETLFDEALAKGSKKPVNAELEAELRKRPDPDSVKTARSPPSDPNAPCQVLVQFKRKRIVQYESPCYVAPGEYVVVGGDRGEDVGLVTHSWATGSADTHQQEETWAEGVGKVLRVASALEVTQLQGVQTELESRAVEVAQEKVLEHALPMRIVDAEYQFDRRKLTFYYQSQHRLDFRNLVRDLYKTFRARIWMEPDGSS